MDKLEDVRTDVSKSLCSVRKFKVKCLFKLDLKSIISWSLIYFTVVDFWLWILVHQMPPHPSLGIRSWLQTCTCSYDGQALDQALDLNVAVLRATYSNLLWCFTFSYQCSRLKIYIFISSYQKPFESLLVLSSVFSPTYM